MSALVSALIDLQKELKNQIFREYVIDWMNDIKEERLFPGDMKTYLHAPQVAREAMGRLIDKYGCPIVKQALLEWYKNKDQKESAEKTRVEAFLDML